MPGREHRRVRLRLPVRLRWTAPFGQQTEACESLDASRSGLLLTCGQPHEPGAVLWVTFPYDAAIRGDQPEIPARVIRCVSPRNGSGAASLAVHYEFASRKSSNGNGNGHPSTVERRAAARRPLAIPIHVRPAGVPWFEEAMTVDVSADSLRFVSTREYSASEPLLVSFAPESTVPWHGEKEFRARIVRVDNLPDTSALAVTVQRVA